MSETRGNDSDHDGDDGNGGAKNSGGGANGDGRKPGPSWIEDGELKRQRLRIQVNIVLESLPGSAVFPPDRPEEMEYLYLKGRILVRDADLARVQQLVAGRVVDALVNGITVFELGDLTTIDALQLIDDNLGIGVATPDHVFYVTPTGACCPATEPDPAHGPLPDPAPIAAAGSGLGATTFVSVVDTGFLSELVDSVHPWLADITGDEETLDPNDIGPYVGHGTFVAGVVRSVAPDSEVHVHGFLTHGGAINESELIRQLYLALDDMPDVISMSAGCTTRHTLPPMGFEVFWEHRLRHCKGTVLVVAAGNNGSRRPFWPAAFEWTVSVGALDRAGQRASFTDFGSWVDVYALGADMVNAYPNGTYHYHEPPRVGDVAQFTEGLCSWSGTSFATPLVAGMIAARMSRTGQSGVRAAESVLRIARAHAVPGVGAIAETAHALDPDPGGF